MSAPERPRIYLVSPPSFELSRFGADLARALDAAEIACVRLEMATRDADAVARAADHLREIAHARDVAMVIADHVSLALRLGLDGVHLSDAARSVRAARKALGPDAIVGSFCAASRHDGMSAGEAGADYVAFGPVGASALAETRAERDLFAWWSQMIEVPVVAEGALGEAEIADLAPVTDFFAFGEELWDADAPSDRLKALIAAIG